MKALHQVIVGILTPIAFSLVVPSEAEAYEEKPNGTVGALEVTYRGYDANDFIADARYAHATSSGFQIVNSTNLVEPNCPMQTIEYPEFGDAATKRGSLDVTIDFSSISLLTNRDTYNGNGFMFTIVVEANGQQKTWRAFLPRYLLIEHDFGDGNLLVSKKNHIERMARIPFTGVLRDVKVGICTVSPHSEIVARNVILDFADYVNPR
ncbi:hypothetical protein [Pendulispora albinea]|uniref:Uncharacterized protein n=1 Tax=Pendulispora albinea TaxID=2741071 RepID=A0ABZ2M4C7_9BACT